MKGFNNLAPRASRGLQAGMVMGALLGAALMGNGAMAATTSGQFNVNVTLTPKCEFFDGGGATSTIADIALAYTSFQTTAVTDKTTFKVRCTNTLGYGLSLDSASVTDGATGLQMALALSSSATTTSTPTATLTGMSGNGNAGQTYYVHATIAANQDGTTTAGTANPQRLLTITY